MRQNGVSPQWPEGASRSEVSGSDLKNQFTSASQHTNLNSMWIKYNS